MSTPKKPRSTTAARKTKSAHTDNKATAPRSRAKTKAADEVRTAPTPKPEATGVSPAASANASRVERNAAETALQGGAPPFNADLLHRRIAEAAYYRAERRGFAPGGEELDWYEAEAEVRGTRKL